MRSVEDIIRNNERFAAGMRAPAKTGPHVYKPLGAKAPMPIKQVPLEVANNYNG